MYAVEIEQDITKPFIEIPEYKTFKSKHVKIIFMTESVESQLEEQPVDFSKYQIGCFNNLDPVKLQREMRDEW
jgi:hypothetical protein